MSQDQQRLRSDAEQIWRAGVQAVDSRRLVHEHLRVEDGKLWLDDEAIELADVGRIAVVGAGKAGAGMAAAVEEVLGDTLLKEKDVVGWVNVPADCVTRLKRIHLHAARPAGQNEPTSAGIEGAEQVFRIVESLSLRDLSLCLISGGGSALLPAPIEGVTLEDKIIITQFLAAAGANIEQLNTVRRHLSRIKGGGLAAACGAGRLITLLISDVIGDPLDVIASGPTAPDPSPPTTAIEVLNHFDARGAGVRQQVFDALGSSSPKPEPRCHVTHTVIGNNAVAVEAAGREAKRLGYSPTLRAARQLEGSAEQVGRQLAQTARTMRGRDESGCLVSGGEPTVTLIEPSRRGLGGRNQQLVLAALQELGSCEEIALLSCGTDGEDGPTDAAGAVVDAAVAAAARHLGLETDDFLRRNDAYHFFEQAGGLIKTGPTHTNVCDLRVVVVGSMK